MSFNVVFYRDVVQVMWVMVQVCSFHLLYLPYREAMVARKAIAQGKLQYTVATTVVIGVVI